MLPLGVFPRLGTEPKKVDRAQQDVVNPFANCSEHPVTL
jgi:hypothetical protein